MWGNKAVHVTCLSISRAGGTVPHGTTPGDKLGRQGPWADSRVGERPARLAGLESNSQSFGGMTLKSNVPQRPARANAALVQNRLRTAALQGSAGLGQEVKYEQSVHLSKTNHALAASARW